MWSYIGISETGRAENITVSGDVVVSHQQSAKNHTAALSHSPSEEQGEKIQIKSSWIKVMIIHWL